MIYSVSFDLLSSGHFHISRGVLNPINESSHLYSLCLQCLDWYEEHGIVNAEQKSEQIDILMENIRFVG